MSRTDRAWIAALAGAAAATPIALLAIVCMLGGLIVAIIGNAGHDPAWLLLTVWTPLADSRSAVGELTRLYAPSALTWVVLVTAAASMFRGRPGLMGGLLLGLLFALPAGLALWPTCFLSQRAVEPFLLPAMVFVVVGLSLAGLILAVLVDRLVERAI